MTAIDFSKWAFLSVASLALIACGGGENPQTPENMESALTAEAQISLADVIANPRRGSEAARDQFRHPLETLEFFEIGPDQRVAEIWPGWYTKILAPYLAANGGTYIAVQYPAGVSDNLDKRMQAFKEAYSDKSVYGEIEYGGLLKDSGPILPPNSVDTILTFRNVHNWMNDGNADQVFQEFYAALKPGGLLGVVEHRLPETALQNPRGRTGYVQESYIKDMAKRAGFEFVASSEVNANPKDTADHPLGVWTLPPSSNLPKAGSEEAVGFDPELYKNIGESDRATLKFRKPL
jgi:predicted methyltransferase